MEKGTPNMEAINKNMKKEMVDFVSFYRRFNNVSGKQSFSTLYTSINGTNEACQCSLISDTFVLRMKGCTELRCQLPSWYLSFEPYAGNRKLRSIHLRMIPSSHVWNSTILVRCTHSVGGPLHFVRHKIPRA